MWGATLLSDIIKVFKKISIHAPMWGATWRRLFMTASAKRFQSTHPCGVRPYMVLDDGTLVAISIHTPMWGATGSKTTHQWAIYFNPRTHVGCDLLEQLDQSADKLFQSTHPCGVRHSPIAVLDFSFGISIHAPMWGATLSRQLKVGFLNQFQSTHPCGVRRIVENKRLNKLIFQSTHPCGVRLEQKMVML